MSNKGDKGPRGMIAFCPVCGSSSEKITWDPKTDTCTCTCGWSDDPDRKKQIREMARELCGMNVACKDCGLDKQCLARNSADILYIAGYRKQSEGEWIDEPNFAQKGLKGKYYVCTNCNVCVPAIEELPLYQWEFCPRCGAKMKGGAELYKQIV